MAARTVPRPPLPDFTGAVCAQIDPELYFPVPGQLTEEMRTAKALCATCPVQEECLDYATSYTVTGIWGGMTDTEREVETRRRGKRRAPVMASEFLPFIRNLDRENEDDLDDEWLEYDGSSDEEMAV